MEIIKSLGKKKKKCGLWRISNQSSRNQVYDKKTTPHKLTAFRLDSITHEVKGTSFYDKKHKNSSVAGMFC